MQSDVRAGVICPPWGSLALAVALALVAACDGGEAAAERKDLEAFANTALDGVEDEKTRAAREADEAARKAAFAERKAKEAAEQKKIEDAIATYAVLPELLPRNLDEGCKAVTEAYVDWIRRQFAEDAGAQMRFFDNKKVRLGELRGKCTKVGKLEAAACQLNVLRETPAGMGAHEKELLGACVERFAPEAYEKVAAEEAALRGADQPG